MTRMSKNRKDVLLRAAFDMLRRAKDDFYVRSPLEIETHYDEADCDGYCLLEDIADELGIYPETEPIALEQE